MPPFVGKQNPTNVWAESRIGSESESGVWVRGLLPIRWVFFLFLALLCMLFNFNGAKSWPWVADAKKAADATKSLASPVEFNVAGHLGRGQAAKRPKGQIVVDM